MKNFALIAGYNGNGQEVLKMHKIETLTINHEEDELGLFDGMDFNDIFSMTMNELKEYRYLANFVDGLFMVAEEKLSEIGYILMAFANKESGAMQYMMTMRPRENFIDIAFTNLAKAGIVINLAKLNNCFAGKIRGLLR